MRPLSKDCRIQVGVPTPKPSASPTSSTSPASAKKHTSNPRGQPPTAITTRCTTPGGSVTTTPRGIQNTTTTTNTTVPPTAKKLSQKELQRKIFLNTLRNVYPNSLQLHYEYHEEEKQFHLHPRSISHICPEISDRLWSELLFRLHLVFLQHVKRRTKVMRWVWTVLVGFLVAYVALGVLVVPDAAGQVAYQVTGPVVFLLLMMVVPNVCFTYLTIRPLLKHFDEWRQDLLFQFDRAGVEVIKITTGEIVSDKSPHRWRGMFWFGSSVWFRFEDAAVEVFWRSVKSGKRVRRYSLMLLNAQGAPKDTEGGIGGGATGKEASGLEDSGKEGIRGEATLTALGKPGAIAEETLKPVTEQEDDDEEVRESQSTLDSAASPRHPSRDSGMNQVDL